MKSYIGLVNTKLQFGTLNRHFELAAGFCSFLLVMSLAQLSQSIFYVYVEVVG